LLLAILFAILLAPDRALAAPPVMATVGPAQPERKLALPPGSGALRVYSQTYKVTAARGGSAVEFPHSGFVLLDRDGKVLRHVENHDGTQRESPVPVALAAGRYAVRARCADYGELLVPVEIAAGQTTVVYLTPAGLPAGFATAGGKLVRLPNGRAIGMAAR
jgi:hypothetical protein